MVLDGAVAVVTGGARGLGRGIALSLARRGAHIAIADLHAPSRGTADYELSSSVEVDETLDALRGLGVRATGVAVDVTNWDQVTAMVATVTNALGPIDILCNNAGVIDSAAVVDTTEAQWNAMMDVNVKGVFLACKAVVPTMVERQRGRIVNVASTAAKRGSPGLAAYCASKFAVLGFTQSLAYEVASSGITVNAVCPGIIGTAMWLDHLMETRSEAGADREAAFEEYVAGAMPLGRAQTPFDIGEAVAYLASADNVTGVALNVAGGSVMH